MTAQRMKSPSAATAEVDWSPLKGGGTNFKTHRLIVDDRNTARFEPTLGTRLFCWIFLGAGLLLLGAGVMVAVENSPDLGLEVLILGVMGLVFSLVGFLMLRFMATPVVFDRARGYFWKGRKDPDEFWNRDELKDFAELGNIVGLQVIGEAVSSDSGSFTSYELNLVLKDGSRLNVVDHGNKDAIVDDAQTLSEFLGVAVLDRWHDPRA